MPNLYDKTGREIMVGDVLKVYHFTAALRRKKYFMYKQVVGQRKFRNGTDALEVSHLDLTSDVYCEARRSPSGLRFPVHQQRGGEMSLHDKIAASHPSLRRGMVWCTRCGRSESVKSAGALQYGWPKCCGYTMTIDSPEERAALQEPRQ